MYDSVSSIFNNGFKQVRHKHQRRNYMETILKTLEDTEAELDKIKTKIEGIETAGLSEVLKTKLDSLLEKEKVVHEAILNKKIAIFEVIASLGTLLDPGEHVGYYSQVSPNISLRFAHNQDELNVSSYDPSKHEQDLKINVFVRDHEPIFYAACDDAIKRIENSIVAVKHNGEGELSELVEVRKRLAKLKL